MKILLLEDDFDYQESISDFLQDLGYEVDSFGDGDEAFDAIYENAYQLLLLDIRVPGMSGYEIVKELRQNENETPVIFMTSLTDINNLSIGYELGCDDYLKKPFALKELQYRLQQLCKLYYYHSKDDSLQLSQGFWWDTNKEMLYKDDCEVKLTKIQQKVIFTLLAQHDCFVTIEHLKDRVWEESYVNDVDVRMCIANIRKKTDKNFIQSQRGYGYKITTQ
ncbi:MAG: response regulator transcription factor [Campylobacterota bacterium]